MGRTPAALFLVDISHEHIALAEARRLGITTIAMVDTNSDPSKVDFPIPANDDATKSIAIIVDYVTNAVMEGLQERAQNKEEEEAAEEVPMEAAEAMDNLSEDEAETREKGERRRISTGRAAGSRGAGRTGAAGKGASPRKS